MQNVPGLSWGPSSPFNARRVVIPLIGPCWVFVDYTKRPYEIVYVVPDFLSSHSLAYLHVIKVGGELNYGEVKPSDEILKSMDTTA